MDKRQIYSAATHQIQTSNRHRVPTSSGVELGATITRPTSSDKVPALVWYDPYRSGADGQPNPMAQYFAQRGYAFVHLNVRGTGNSAGFSTDEYTAAETQDGADAITYLSQAPWCSGKLGMLGASYSGFNTLQVAALAPPQLKAIAPAYFTDRRYTDDCHYKGGCLRGYYDILTYGLSMVAMNALPPFPAAVGNQWSDLWRQRLEQSEPYLLKWLAHQTEDDYWATGSIAGHYHQIKAATLLIGGWHDGYPNPPLRVFGQLQSPKKLLVGPWSHTYPDQSHCGPRIHIYFELLRWWDHWLKDMDNGVADEPAVQVYEQHFEPPRTDRTTLAGAWRTADSLPDDQSLSFFLAADNISPTAAPSPGCASVPYLPAASRNGGLWDAGVPFTLPGEQSEDSARALNFSGPPLEADLPIFGNPTFTLHISADTQIIPVAVRLLEVAPDNTSVLVTKGILNATRRQGMDAPQALKPGQITPVSFHLEATAWRFKQGNRIRLSVNGADFPNVWPTPQNGTLTLHWGPSHPSQFTLPVWGGGRDLPFAFVPSPSTARPTGSGSAPWRVIHDVLEDRYRLQIERGNGEMGVDQRQPAQAWANSCQSHQVQWPGFDTICRATGALTSDAEHFYLNLALEVTLNGTPYFNKNWSQTYRRELL